METLVALLEIDSRSRRTARRIWPLIENRTADLAETFYADVERFAAEPARTVQALDFLKTSQREHWRSLFESRFDDHYFRSASLIGIRHCEMGLDCKWHVVGYAKMKHGLAHEILHSRLPIATKARLIAILDKYLAIDMAVSLSSYTCVLLD